MDLDWVQANGRWHIVAERSDTAKMRCGAIFEIDRVLTAAEEDLPPNPCSGCLVDWGMGQMTPEPLDDAMRRGYEPA